MATFDEIEKKLRVENFNVYLIGLVSGLVSRANILFYGGTDVQEKHRKRKLGIAIAW